MIDSVNLAEKFALFNEHWSPKIVGEVDDFAIKLARLQGEFVWHLHENEDEMFLVISGQLHMQFRDRTVIVKPGEFIVVPKGVEHNPLAPQEVHVVLFERKNTVNTGNIEHERTLTQLQRI